jgi:outer membrane protein OmpA-like peptidoglycan-associated protein
MEGSYLPGGKSMKIPTTVVAFVLCATLVAQSYAASASVPLYKVTVVQNSTKAINYRYLKSSTMIDFKGTVLLADAKGSAEVKSKAGATEIDAEFENLPAATQFGPAYFTYVLWAISPEGRPNNLGQLIVNKGKSRLKVTEKLQTFGLIVTAEPYFAVSSPSNVVVLENAVRSDTKGKVETIDAKYELLERGQYEVNIAPSELGMTMDPKTPLAVYEARNAVRIAKAAGAETYAPEALMKARELLAVAETNEGGKKGRSATAREAVQRAEDARFVSVKRQQAESLATERQTSKDLVTSAKGAATTAALGQAQAENAQAKAELAKGQSDTARLAAEATSAAAETARGQANAGRMAAESAATSAELAANRATSERDVAVGQAQRAESEKMALRAQLKLQLNSILQTRESARGLIVNMSGVMFETGKSQLRPAAREKLAKISGIVMAHPGLKLEVEGHTDTVGSSASNQTLSERRAGEARSYLISQGIPAADIVSRGFGSTQPIGSNDTADGRQSNRRVELVLSGEGITHTQKASQ